MEKTESTTTRVDLKWDSAGMGEFTATIVNGRPAVVDMRLTRGDSQNSRLIVREHSDDAKEFLRRVHLCVGELLAELDLPVQQARPAELQYNSDYRFKDTIVRGRVVDGNLELHGYPGAKFNPEHFTKVSNAL